ncbi:MAG: hypothetical protein JNM34_10075 [Chthonomonadaceae bacterium]|nr:hypothetical protein [Chthonomonadaceae bacterium]
MKFDPYIFDALMRDLVGHSRSPAAFVVYLHLYRQSVAMGHESVSQSLALIADSTGLSKRAVQIAILHLVDRQLLQVFRAGRTSVPAYTVLTPWRRLARFRTEP